MSRKQNAHGHPQACLACLSQRSHADSGMYRWDSDDLPDISDDEWDDEE